MVGTPVRMFAFSLMICFALIPALNLMHMILVARIIMHMCILMHKPKP